ncbi:MAG: FAD-binding protein [Planctomycetota bacterium]|nr:MAG: FAD-binding protein [Planctomycetota bacterium]
MSRKKRWLRRLREIVGKEYLLTDPASLLAYESDALTLFRSQPAAVVLPASEAECIAVVRLLAAEKIPFTARGAGTGLSGGAVVEPGGVVLALSRMQKILTLDPQQGFAVVEPGVVNDDLNREAARWGLRYAPDPSSQTVCTLGGNLGENAGGPHCFKHGMTSQHVLFAKVVTATGKVETWGDAHSVPEDLDLRGFLVGSEGSVAVALQIGLRLIPKPQAIVTLFAAFDSIAGACAAVQSIVAQGLMPVALEVMDQRAIRAVEASVYRCGLPTDAGAILLVDVEGPENQIQEEAEAVEVALQKHRPMKTERAQSPEQRRALWKGRKGAGGAMGRLGPDSYVMDGVVPRSKLVQIMAYVEQVEQETDIPVANLFHAGDGNIHPHFSYDSRDRSQADKVEAAGAKILRKCLELGGSLSGEHGIGLEKEALLQEQFEPQELALMERLRRVFNPEDLLNRGRGLPLGSGCAEAFHRHGGRP